MREYVLRLPDTTGDFVETKMAESPENALNAVYTFEWSDLHGRTEVYNAGDVPGSEDYHREEFPVGDAEPVLVVDVGMPVEIRQYEVITGEEEGEKQEFEVGTGF